MTEKKSDEFYPAELADQTGIHVILGQTPASVSPDPNSAALAAFSYQHAGPLPDPMTLGVYGQVDPSLPMAIVGMAQKQQGHDHKMAEDQLKHSNDILRFGFIERMAGRACAIVGVIALVVGSVCLSNNGHGEAAAALGGVAAVGIIGPFVYGKVIAPRESKKQPDAPTG
ncbi:MAG: hypothetical protein KF902_07400 [Phycisphaeraceae bacterium]|nr:hypothetical protein [Phycisphaeraceae bacterium]